MESSGDLVSMMVYNSIKIIISECKYQQDQQSCYQFDTLKIDNWEDMFVLQIVSFCLGQVWIFSAATLIILFKVKHVQATQKVDQEIKNNLQSQAQQGQMAFFQPVIQQALPQQNFYLYNQNNQQPQIPPLLIPQHPQYIKQNQEYVLGQPVSS
ncbi:transmembrane protein, putative (macronuclear) [Tetrahymena thermophila SB210]|uniref:Transmembrane protein, putative n=1 Tax=Tetrahymena thermophila (strain SB210) TaxID=312017 RepID=Q23YB0_TETTS|nr:transmembrane protein, putative [Tetrahymena thermophila SB210]EAS01554.1 transmembrane protein, putative [Tetrahymena thermophila SB210]|eukprot:XP_001021799.1 transmembrane protein, putative [Tetrahymena thermophila SB210]